MIRCVTVTENVSVLVCVPVSPAGEGNPVINHHVKISATATEGVSVSLQTSEYNSLFLPIALLAHHPFLGSMVLHDISYAKYKYLLKSPGLLVVRGHPLLHMVIPKQTNSLCVWVGAIWPSGCPV